MVTQDLEIDHKTALGQVLDSVIRRAAVLSLTDFYIGARVDYESEQVEVYFARDAKPDVLKQLSEDLSQGELEAQFTKVEAGEAYGWVLQVQPSKAVRTEPEVTGNVPIEVPVEGDVVVREKGKSSEGASSGD